MTPIKALISANQKFVCASNKVVYKSGLIYISSVLSSGPKFQQTIVKILWKVNQTKSDSLLLILPNSQMYVNLLI